ncbi:MAG: winged helix-turn-helix domain-containing protein, partial [Terriglobales bacterium]
MASAPPFRFGPFEFDPAAGELRRAGEKVHLQDKPLRLLQILAARAGEVVPRAELQQALWPGQSFGDFDDGLNTVVRKLREALADDAEQPRYIVTVPRRGYRWVAPLEPVAAAGPPAAPA